MGNVHCCAQTAPDTDAWKTGGRRRTLSRDEAKVLMPMYDYEPSLSLDHEGRASSTMSNVDSFPETPQSVSSNQALVEDSSAGRDVGVHDKLTEEDKAAVDDGGEMSPEARALLPAPNSCPRSGINLRRQSPTFGSSHSQAPTPRRTQSFNQAPTPPCIEDYLCECKACPRAMMIQRAFKLYSFALDHPESDALLRVLRACANYDETIVEVDPLLVLHAEKMLEQLRFDEDQAFRLLIASHFQRT